MRSLETKKHTSAAVPSSTTIFISLYLILLAFFISITSGLSFDKYKQTTAMWSIGKTFGSPSDSQPVIPSELMPKVSDYEKNLEALFGNEAKIQTSTDRSKTTLILAKDYFYYPDEVSIKPTQLAKANKLFDILRNLNKTSSAKISIALSLGDFAMDKQRLAFFKTQLADANIDLGLTYENSTQLTIITEQ